MFRQNYSCDSFLIRQRLQTAYKAVLGGWLIYGPTVVTVELEEWYCLYCVLLFSVAAAGRCFRLCLMMSLYRD